MADVTVEEGMETYGPRGIERDDLLTLEDPNYAPDNVAIVTGGGGGIGRGTAQAFAANGPTVTAIDRRRDRPGRCSNAPASSR